MADDTPLKSAYDLAMERLRRKDRDEGLEESKPLTEAQKQRISELRRDANAKLAEIEILHRKDLEAARGDPEKLRDLEKKQQIDRGRVESRLESAVEKVHRGD
jgi:Spy/CpxP family protein refolding chaperone